MSENENEGLRWTGSLEQRALDPLGASVCDTADADSNYSKAVEEEVRRRVFWESQAVEWLEELMRDQEYMLDPFGWNALARKAVLHWAHPALRRDMDRLRLGDHPGIIMTLAHMQGRLNNYRAEVDALKAECAALAEGKGTNVNNGSDER